MPFVCRLENKLRNGEDGMAEGDLQVSFFVHNTAVFYFSVTVWRWFKRQMYCQNVLWNKPIWRATLQLDTNKVSSNLVPEMYDIFAAFNKGRKF